jgi:hypothetical protein
VHNVNTNTTGNYIHVSSNSNGIQFSQSIPPNISTKKLMNYSKIQHDFKKEGYTIWNR